MKPENITPVSSIEKIPAPVGYAAERSVDQVPKFEKSPERGDASELQQPTVTNVTILPANTYQTEITPTDDVAVTTITGAPLFAKDDDLIEKEWVDRAKKIISDTKNDPFKREESVSKLQVDYLKKRYGRELGVSK